MRYIIGTKIAGQQSPVQQSGARSRSVGQPQLTRHSQGDSKFKPGMEYTLYHIYKNDDGFVYVFVSGDEDRVEVVFDTPKAADTYIARLRGDTLSD